MPRPTKARRICHAPRVLSFAPVGEEAGKEPVIMTLDEYETVRLIDLENLSQEQCSAAMEVARTTAQKIYESARRKLASAIVEGRPLVLQGGEYRLCNGQQEQCGFPECHMRRLFQTSQESKGENTMRIAVTYENGLIFQHFGHTETFKVYDVEDGRIIGSQVVGTNGMGHGALAGVLNALQADVLICGGIGGGAQNALANAGIRLFGGVSGSADAAVEALLSGKLLYNPDVRCNHHDHGEGHSCGSHGCGSHGCH